MPAQALRVMTSVATDEHLPPAGPLTGPSALECWRQRLTWALATIWLLDAALQYQPYMFTRDFPNQVIKPVGDGSPPWVSAPTHWAGTLMAEHIEVWNALFATVQLAIAIGLFLRRTTRLALAASIVWAVTIWWLGEGLGGALAGPVSALMGLPGAAIIYALIAVLLWPRPAFSAAESRQSVADSSPLGTLWGRVVWVLLWASFVGETLRAANRSPSALHGMVTGMEDGEPGWIKAIDRWGGSLLAGRGTQFSIVLAVLFAVIAICVFVPQLTRPALIAAIILAGLIWVFGEDFGEIATGDATDPNSGPLLALLALCYWPLGTENRDTRWNFSRSLPH